MKKDAKLVILSRDLVRLIRGQLELELNFLSLVHSASASDKFERYNELKQFVWLNSFEVESQLVLDPVSLFYSLDSVIMKCEVKRTRIKRTSYTQTMD